MVSWFCQWNVPTVNQTRFRKNAHRRGKQNHRCLDYGRQFIANLITERGYSDDTRRLCLRMYVNGMGFRGIARVTGIHHIAVINLGSTGG